MKYRYRKYIIYAIPLFMILLIQCSNRESQFYGKWKYEKQEKGDDTLLTTFREFEFFKGGNVSYRYIHFNPFIGGPNRLDIQSGVASYKFLDDKKIMVKDGDKFDFVFSFEFENENIMVLTDRVNTRNYYTRIK